jgi:hypothetical protein
MKSNNNQSNKSSFDLYLFDHFNLKVMMGDIRFSRNALLPGSILPDLKVIMDNGDTTTLYEMAKAKPLLLVTGSITCPMTISSLPMLKTLQENMADDINIALVYVREAHPGEHYPQPSDIDGKRCNALDLKEIYSIRISIIIDDVNGRLHKMLDTKPNSAHLIDSSGKILLQTLWAGDAKTIQNEINQIVHSSTVRYKLSQSMFFPFFQGAGFMNDTLNLAGKRSYRELMYGAPPIWILSKSASMLSFLPMKDRGWVSALLILIFAISLVLLI